MKPLVSLQRVCTPGAKAVAAPMIFGQGGAMPFGPGRQPVTRRCVRLHFMKRLKLRKHVYKQEYNIDPLLPLLCHDRQARQRARSDDASMSARRIYRRLSPADVTDKL